MGAMIVVMLNVKVYRIIFWDFYLVYRHAYAALSSRGFLYLSPFAFRAMSIVTSGRYRVEHSGIKVT